MTEQVIPSRASAERLDSLTSSLQPSNVKYLLAPSSQYSLEECMDCAKTMWGEFEKFVANGYSEEGIDVPYQVETL